MSNHTETILGEWMRRYYVTVHGVGDGTLLPSNAGDMLRQQAMSNLRPLRIESGFDYRGIEIQGITVNETPSLNFDGIRQRIPSKYYSDTRIIVSETPVVDINEDPGFGLVLSISRGKDFSWNPGLATLAADVRVSNENSGEQISAVVLDIFQELMLANSDSIQAVLDKFIKSGGSQDAFYRAKADFAAEMIKNGQATTLFDQYTPDRYACFATLARSDLYAKMDVDERSRFAVMWSNFLKSRFADYFLSSDEAVELILAGAFHKSRPELVPGGGVRTGASVRYGDVDEAQLRRLLSDNQVVRHSGPYILCLITKKPTVGNIDLVGSLFGWSDSKQKRIRSMKLFAPNNYQRAIPLVRQGFVTPIRLFLKAI